MNRILVLLVSLLVVSMTLFGCKRDRQPDELPEAEAESVQEEPAPPVVEEPAFPTCGGYVVIVESPTVTGNVDGDRIVRALMEGLNSAGCPNYTGIPSGMPAGTPVLNLAPRVQSMGGTTLNISVVATDTSTGEVHSRHQERAASGDGTAEARTLAQTIAGRLMH